MDAVICSFGFLIVIFIIIVVKTQNDMRFLAKFASYGHGDLMYRWNKNRYELYTGEDVVMRMASNYDTLLCGAGSEHCVYANLTEIEILNERHRAKENGEKVVYKSILASPFEMYVIDVDTGVRSVYKRKSFSEIIPTGELLRIDDPTKATYVSSDGKRTYTDIRQRIRVAKEMNMKTPYEYE